MFSPATQMVARQPQESRLRAGATAAATTTTTTTAEPARLGLFQGLQNRAPVQQQQRRRCSCSRTARPLRFTTSLTFIAAAATTRTTPVPGLPLPCSTSLCCRQWPRLSHSVAARTIAAAAVAGSAEVETVEGCWSVVIPTYNRLPILSKCLQALEGQKMSPEHGLIDYEVCTSVSEAKSEMGFSPTIESHSLSYSVDAFHLAFLQRRSIYDFGITCRWLSLMMARQTEQWRH